MKHFTFLIAFCLFLLPNYIDSENSEILVVLKHSACFWNKKYVDKLAKPRKPINSTMSISSIDCYFKPGVSLNAPLYVRLTSYRKFATQYKPIMINTKIEICEALKYRNHPLFIFFLITTMNKTDSNLLDPCPLKGHRFVAPYYTTYFHLPPLIPVGMWRMDIRIIKGAEEVLKIQNYYEITAKGIIEF